MHKQYIWTPQCASLLYDVLLVEKFFLLFQILMFHRKQGRKRKGGRKREGEIETKSKTVGREIEG